MMGREGRSDAWRYGLLESVEKLNCLLGLNVCIIYVNNTML